MATSSKQRLKYTDTNGDTQIIGEISGPGDEKGLSRAQLFHRAQQYDKLTCYGDASLVENIPQDNTEIQGNPFIIFEIYDPDTASWSENWRGFNPDGGRLNRGSETKLKLWSTIRYYGKQEVTLDPEQNPDLNNTDNVGVMEEVVSGIPNVVLDAPTETEVQNNSDQSGYFTIKRYAMKGQERGRVLHEMTKVLGWALKPTGNKDGSGNWIWRYEPSGYGGTVDTIQDESAFQFSASESRGKIRNWIFEDKKDVVNIVEIKNTSKSVTKSVTGVDTSNNIFTVSGDLTGVMESGTELLVTDSTGNDGLYTVSSVSYDSNNSETDITVNENVSNSTADGSVSISAETVLGRYSAGSEPSPNSVDRYGERYQSHQVNFMETGGDADRLAKRIVDKNKEASEGGNLKVSPRYDGNEANNSFAIGSRKRNIYTDQDIVGVSTSNDEFVVSGNVTGNLSLDDLFDVQGSTGNDGTYTVASLSYDSGNDETTIGVDESVTDATADGQARIYAKVFTVTQQINHYPENSTDFTVTFEREVEKKAVMAEDLRSERNKLYPKSSEGLVGQTGSTAPTVLGQSGDTAPDVAGDTGDSSPAVGGQTGDSSPLANGQTGRGGGGTTIDDDEQSETNKLITSSSWTEIASSTNSFGRAAGCMIYLGSFTASSADSSADYNAGLNRVDFRIKLDGTVEVPEESGITPPNFFYWSSNKIGEGFNRTLRLPDSIPDGATVTVEAQSGGGDIDMSTGATFHYEDTHQHDAQNDGGSLEADPHPHDGLDNGGTLESALHPHDDGTLDADNHPHDDGTYDADNHPHEGGNLKGQSSEEDKTTR